MALNIDRIVANQKNDTSPYPWPPTAESCLSIGQWITSPNGFFIAKFEPNGDLVIYHRYTGAIIWKYSSLQPASRVFYTYVWQPWGDYEIPNYYKQPAWKTGGSHILVTWGGDLLIVNGSRNTTVWGMDYFQSMGAYAWPKGKNYFCMQSDGNAVLYDQNNKCQWSSNTFGVAPQQPSAPVPPIITGAADVKTTSLTINAKTDAIPIDFSTKTPLPIIYTVTCTTTNTTQTSTTGAVVFSNLSPNTTYTFIAYVTTTGTDPQTNKPFPVIQSGASGQFVAKTLAIVLPAITNLDIDKTSLQQTSVNLTFTPPFVENTTNTRTDIDSYNVYSGSTLLTTVQNTWGATTKQISYDYNQWQYWYYPITSYSPSKISLPLTKLTAGTSYSNITVTSVYAGTPSAVSNSVAFKTPGGVPLAPTNLLASNVTQTSVTISFTAPSGVSVDSYFIMNGPTTVGNPTGTSFTITGLIAYTTYNFTVVSKSGGNSSTASSPLSVITLPLPPAPPTIASITPTSGSAAVNFTAPYSAAPTKYNVFNGPNVVGTATSPGFPILVNGLDPNTKYSFIMKATNDGGTSEPTAPFPFTTPPLIPSAPTNLSTSNATSNSLVLTFVPPSGPVTDYVLYLNGSATNTVIATSPFTITSLVQNKNYTFSLVARNSAGSSPQSNTCSADTKADPPTNIVATNINENAVTLNATVPSGTIYRYNLYMNNNVYGQIWQFPYTITGLSQNTKYSFTVASLNYAGASEMSLPVTFTTLKHIPSAATNLTASNVKSTSLTISYNPSPDPADKYSLYAGNALLVSNSSPTAFNLSGLTPNTNYSFTIVSSNAGADSMASNALSVTTLPALPDNVTNISGSNITATSINISFSVPPGAVTGYYVYSGNSLFQTITNTNLPITVNGLTPNTNYYLAVVPYNASGTSSNGSSLTSLATLQKPDPIQGINTVNANGVTYLTFMTLPVVPSVPTISKVVTTSTTISLTVTSMSIASLTPVNIFYIYNGSQILKQVNQLQNTALGVYTANVVIDTLTPNTTYNLSAVASNLGGQSGKSSVTQAITLPPMPAPPSGVQLLNVTQNSISVSFTASPAGELVTGYTSSIGSGIGTVSNYTIQNLTPGTAYQFTMFAINATGTSQPSSQMSATTLPTVPSVPMNLKCNGSGPNSIIIGFTAPSGPVNSYTVTSLNNVYGPFLASNLNVANGVTQIMVQNLTPATQYSFTIFATNAGGNSNTSEPFSCSTSQATTTRTPIMTTQAPTQTQYATTRAPIATTQSPITTAWSPIAPQSLAPLPLTSGSAITSTYASNTTSRTTTKSSLTTTYSPAGSLTSTYGSYGTTASFQTTLPSKVTTNYAPIVITTVRSTTAMPTTVRSTTAMPTTVRPTTAMPAKTTTSKIPAAPTPIPSTPKAPGQPAAKIPGQPAVKAPPPVAKAPPIARPPAQPVVKRAAVKPAVKAPAPAPKTK
jgi:hypothetical protein